MKYVGKVINISAIILLLAGCTSSSPVVKSPSFELGEKDGCSTATGTYMKNSESFKNDKDYADGWFYGRKNCNPVQSR